jgi:16S rRNA (adenine1518-N6/adenine1519-N6)-dimethyltransferase
MLESPPAKKALGQHWLRDQNVLKQIIQSAQVNPSDTVLEIGPGTGELTRHLVKAAKQVIAVELDRALAQKLASLQIADNLQVIEEDILKFNLNKLPKNYKVIGNIPYYLTSNLIRVLSESTNQAQRAVLLVQKEVAQRAAAQPGSMSMLSVSAQFYWQVELGVQVPAELFSPPPKVDSQVLILKRRTQPLFKGIDSKKFFKIVKAGFSAKRKTLQNNLSRLMGLDKQATAEVLKSCGVAPNQRAQMLSLKEWHKLYKKLTYLNSLS